MSINIDNYSVETVETTEGFLCSVNLPEEWGGTGIPSEYEKGALLNTLVFIRDLPNPDEYNELLCSLEEAKLIDTEDVEALQF